MTTPRPLLVLPILFLALLAVPAFGEEGVTAKEVVLGQSCALSGPAQALGEGMQAGLLAAFGEANAAGGIEGRKIRLISRDDGYEPQRAIQNTTALLEEDGVFLLIGEVGTPTSQAVLPIAEKAGVPFFGPFTGAEFLRDPYRPLVVNVRASYFQEMEALAAYLVDEKKLTRIACFYQNDGYGQAGLAGITRALEKRDLELAATGTYERNTVAIKSGLLRVRKGKPEAVVMVGAYKPCAAFIELARRVGMEEVVYCNISFVGTEALLKELGEAEDGCIVSQVVTYPWDTEVELVRRYQAAMKAHQPEAKLGFVSLEGYLVGRLFCEAASKVEGPLTRQSLLATLAKTGTFDLGGVTLQFGPEDHQGSDEVFLTVLRDGQVLPLDE